MYYGVYGKNGGGVYYSWSKVLGSKPYVKSFRAKKFQTRDEAVEYPLFHSDRGFQYTNRVFHHKLEKYGMIQSMSRVAHCIDNGPMEGFWGILKRECYYGKRFTDRLSLIHTIKSYIAYYNNKRVQRSLGILTPMEKHNIYMAA